MLPAAEAKETTRAGEKKIARLFNALATVLVRRVNRDDRLNAQPTLPQPKQDLVVREQTAGSERDQPHRRRPTRRRRQARGGRPPHVVDAPGGVERWTAGVPKRLHGATDDQLPEAPVCVCVCVLAVCVYVCVCAV